MEKFLKLVSALAGGFFMLNTVSAAEVPKFNVVTDVHPGVWNTDSGSCSCYPYLMTEDTVESEEACTAPDACYEEQVFTEDGVRVFNPAEALAIEGAGDEWYQGFIALHNNNKDAGIRLYDDVTVRHHIFNNNNVNDLLRISPFYDLGGISIDQSGHVGVNRGNQAARTHLDVNGVIHLNVYSSAPSFPGCNFLNATDGAIALTSRHTFCVCKGSGTGGWGWVNANDGVTSCVWQ